MKKVLVVITLKTSAEGFIGDQMRFFQEEGGYECHLICSPHKELSEYAQSQRIRYKSIEIERTLSPIKDIKAFIAIYKYIKKERFDVLIAHSFPKACLLSMTAAKLAKVPHRIEVAHGALQEGLNGLIRRLVILSERLNSRNAEKVVVVSPSVARVRVKDGIDEPQKQTLLANGTCNGVDTVNQFNPARMNSAQRVELKNKLKLSDSDYVIGYCGRLVRDKGIVELVDGFKMLSQKYPEKSIKLLIVGSPEKRDALPSETLNILTSDSRIVYTGFVPYAEIAQYYSLMDVFILPSYREGFPTVVLEASAMELPVITTRKTGCIDSIIDRVTGLFVDLDAGAVANALELTMSKDFAHKLGQNGRKWVKENYEHAIVKEAMLNLINSLTQDTKTV